MKRAACVSALVCIFLACVVAVRAQNYGYDYSYGYDFGGGSYADYSADNYYGYDGDFDDDFDWESNYDDDSYYDFGSYGGGDLDSAYNNFGGYGAGSYGADADGYGGYYDQYGYYGDDDSNYYEYYGYYAGDSAGYEDYYDEEYGEYYEECFFDANGKPVLLNTTASCDTKIKGVDKVADKLSGGIDGIYKFVSCYHGKPLYRRDAKGKPAGEERVLWYSSTFGDWDVSRGTEPNEAEILMYGGDMEHASTPLFVSAWHLGGDLSSGGVADKFAPVAAVVTCADGTTYADGEVTTSSRKTGPVLTDAEMEAKYQFIYDRYKAGDPSPSINFTFVVLLVMTGLTIVLAIPYFLLKKRGGAAAGGGPKYEKVGTSFAQMLQQSRKKTVGHIA